LRRIWHDRGYFWSKDVPYLGLIDEDKLLKANFFRSVYSLAKKNEFYIIGDKTTCKKCCSCHQSNKKYRMKDNGDDCKSFNCDDGEIINCPRGDDPTFDSANIYDSISCALTVPFGDPKKDSKFSNPGKGGKNGGVCVCPDGNTYFVGNDPSDDSKLACTGDDPANRSFYDFPGFWSYTSLDCLKKSNRPVSRFAKKIGNTITGMLNPGVNGGYCKCPNGQIYPVADKWNDCATSELDYALTGEENSLNCIGGEIYSECQIKESPLWKHRGVVCDQTLVYDYRFRENP